MALIQKAPKTLAEAISIAEESSSTDPRVTSLRLKALAVMKAKEVSENFTFIVANHLNADPYEVLKMVYDPEAEERSVAFRLFSFQRPVMTWEEAKQNADHIKSSFGVVVPYRDLFSTSYKYDFENEQGFVYSFRSTDGSNHLAKFGDDELDADVLYDKAMVLLSRSMSVRAAKKLDDRSYSECVIGHVEFSNKTDAIENGIHAALAGKGWL
jgi:hypothetical protein